MDFAKHWIYRGEGSVTSRAPPSLFLMANWAVPLSCKPIVSHCASSRHKPRVRGEYGWACWAAPFHSSPLWGTFFFFQCAPACPHGTSPSCEPTWTVRQDLPETQNTQYSQHPMLRKSELNIFDHLLLLTEVMQYVIWRVVVTNMIVAPNITVCVPNMKIFVTNMSYLSPIWQYWSHFFLFFLLLSNIA